MERLPKNLQEKLDEYEIEVYRTPRAGRERVFLALNVGLGFVLLGLMVALPRWPWRLACAVAFVALAFAFDSATRVRPRK